MNKTTLMCVFVAFTVILVNQPLSARETTMCDLKVSVTESTAENSKNKVGTSVDEILKEYYSVNPHYDIGNPFSDSSVPYIHFARQVESDLLEAVRVNFCADASSDSPVFVDITFLKLEMATQNPYHAQISKQLATMKSAYADVEIEKHQRKIKATIIWNPRRILRDRLILEGYVFDDTEPLAPFLASEFSEFMHKYSEKVQGATFLHERPLLIAELKGTVPDDIYGLFTHSDKTSRRPFPTMVDAALYRLPIAFHSGHAAIVKLVIDRAFVEGASPVVISIRDIKRPDIEELYQARRW